MPTKIEPASEKCHHDTSKKVFGLLALFLRGCGFYIGQAGSNSSPVSKCAKVAMMIYCVFCNLCAIFNAARVMVMYEIASTSLLRSLPYNIFYMELVCLSISLALSLPKHFPKFIELFDSKKEKYPSCGKYLCRLRKCMFIVIITLFCMYLMVTTVGAVLGESIEKYDTLLNKLHLPSKYIGTILNIVTSLFGTCSIYVLCTLFNVISYCIYKEFDLYSKKFRTIYQGGKDDFDLKFQDLWDEHVHICKMLKAAQGFIKHYLFVTYLATIPTLCFFVFVLIKRQLSINEMGFTAVIFLLCVFQIVDITLVGVFINDKAHEPLQIIRDSNWASLSGETLQKITMYSSRLSSGGIGYSVYGLVTIDRSTILMIFGTILTYVVVVLQF